MSVRFAFPQTAMTPVWVPVRKVCLTMDQPASIKERIENNPEWVIVLNCIVLQETLKELTKIWRKKMNESICLKKNSWLIWNKLYSYFGWFCCCCLFLVFVICFLFCLMISLFVLLLLLWFVLFLFWGEKKRRYRWVW